MRLPIALVLLLVLGCRKHPAEPVSQLQRTLEQAKVPGIAIAVVKHGAVTRTEAAGNVTNDTPLEAASIAKIVIGIAVMQLVERGKLGLDDDASSHLPFTVRNPEHPKTPITIRMLLDHTSSLKDPADLESTRDPDLAAFLHGAMQFTSDVPGTRTEYSNMGASIAAVAIEKESGQPFEAYVRDAIFVPAGVRATYRPLHAVYPVVDLWATAGDLGRLLAVIERGGAPLLAPASVDTMLKDHLGWQSIDLAGREVLGHEGEDRSASTALFFDPKTNSGAVILTNGDAFSSGDPARAKALQDLLAELLR